MPDKGTALIKTLLDKCDERDAASNADRWTAAQLIHDKVVAGMSLRQLAKDISSPEQTRSYEFVRRYNKVWEQFGDPSGNPTDTAGNTLSFAECMTQIRLPKEPTPVPESPEPVEVPNPAVRIPGRDFPHPEPIVVEHPNNPETPEPLGEFKAVMSVGDHRMAITSSILAMVELAQDSKGYEDDLADLFEATIQEIESALEALKSVVRTKSISIEDFLQ